MAKYRFTGEKMFFKSVWLNRIEATSRIYNKVKIIEKGDIGGWIEKVQNLSRKNGDNCWVDKEAKVFNDARVKGNALVTDNAVVSGKAVVKDDSCISGNASIKNSSVVCDEATVQNHAEISGLAVIQKSSHISHYATVFSSAVITDKANIGGNAHISGNAVIGHSCIVGGNAIIGGVVRIMDNFIITEGQIVVLDEGRKYLTNMPIAISGLKYKVTITDKEMRIGCQYHTFDQWFNYSNKAIDCMDSDAGEFWAKHKDMLLNICIKERSYIPR